MLAAQGVAQLGRHRVWLGDGGDRWFWLGGGQPGAARSGAPGALAAAGPCIKPSGQGKYAQTPDDNTTRPETTPKTSKNAIYAEQDCSVSQTKSACQHAVSQIKTASG
jgi:hypothetical protein